MKIILNLLKRYGFIGLAAIVATFVGTYASLTLDAERSTGVGGQGVIQNSDEITTGDITSNNIAIQQLGLRLSERANQLEYDGQRALLEEIKTLLVQAFTKSQNSLSAQEVEAIADKAVSVAEETALAQYQLTGTQFQIAEGVAQFLPKSRIPIVFVGPYAANSDDAIVSINGERTRLAVGAIKEMSEAGSDCRLILNEFDKYVSGASQRAASFTYLCH